ncbi:DUF29 domain-containing protein [Endozoicomonas sp. GU-1]|uniref:DUF29 domain-containing protein n=1 Tax=Endozoicomonas sp. GU-1 TaxID=3009078 RepID=UPI0022B4E456|nr:DUF29 domain-containing protein [Endozoicomonas sp. GU-1]WBA81429.1 DUF29 domain-containing protein [Endozoicomonas sp. GU-1]WBA84377.1 DUF29 domain-containing protein [Endozoicomonas sp. GU-1]
MNNLYHTDRYQWIEQQKQLFRNGQYDQLDIENLFWEIEGMGSELGALEHRLTTLIHHLLNYDYQQRVLNPVLHEPYNCWDWITTIRRTRLAINKLIKKNPHIQPQINEQLAEAYPDAKKLAIDDMNQYVQPHQRLTANSFPSACPWTYDQMVQEDWLP